MKTLSLERNTFLIFVWLSESSTTTRGECFTLEALMFQRLPLNLKPPQTRLVKPTIKESIFWPARFVWIKKLILCSFPALIYLAVEIAPKSKILINFSVWNRKLIFIFHFFRCETCPLCRNTIASTSVVYFTWNYVEKIWSF